MQFSIDVRNSFGRYDINQVKLIMISPGETSYPFEKIFSNNELKLDNQGLVGNYSWIYNAGIESGEYGIELEITDLQGNTVSFIHDGIEILEVGVAVDLGENQPDIVLVAPAQTSSAPCFCIQAAAACLKWFIRAGSPCFIFVLNVLKALERVSWRHPASALSCRPIANACKPQSP